MKRKSRRKNKKSRVMTKNKMKEKKATLRMCIVCRQMVDRIKLNRVVRLPDGNVVLDENGKVEGRGAYVCRSEQCVAKCKKAKLLNKHLKMTVPEEIYQELKINE